MEKKYKILRGEKIKVGQKEVYRIKALRDFEDIKEGDIGGHVQSEANLSHEGTCWIYKDAVAYDNSKVFEDAMVHGKSRIYGNAKIRGESEIYGEAEVFEWATVKDHAIVNGDARVGGYSVIDKNSIVSGTVNGIVKGSLFENKSTKIKSTKVLTDYYNSKQFQADLKETELKAQAYRNHEKVEKELKIMNVEHSVREPSNIKAKETLMCRKQFKILVVEDDKQVRKMLREFLIDDCGFVHVDIAENGIVAQEMLEKHQYNLILSDYIMPRMNGYALWTHIKKIDYKTTFILISGYNDNQFKQLRKAGVFCVPKDGHNCMETIEKLALGYYVRDLNNKMAKIS